MKSVNQRENYEQQNLQQAGATNDPFTVERYQQFARLLPSGVGRILDVGCSDGRGGEALKQALPQCHLMGLDCVQERLNALPQCYAERVLGLSNSIPLDDQSLDAIVAGEFLEHLYPADVDPTLCEFQRVLKTGGVLLLTTPHPNCFKSRILGHSVYSVSHLTQHYPDVLRLRLKMHGFNHVTLRGSGKATRLFGSRFPLLGVYGSYLMRAVKI
jgi:ubiquinone/menaquinone biosynthesis C-methylase UbiE